MLQSGTLSKTIDDAVVDIILSEDLIEAYMEINFREDMIEIKQPEESIRIPYEQLMDFIRESGISYGIIEENVRALSEQSVPTEALKIAEGIPVTHGKDGYIHYHVQSIESSKLIEDAQGNINFKELEWFTQVNIGDMLAEKVLPIEGKDGMDVQGNVIVATQGKMPVFKYGKHVGETPDGMTLMALQNGRLEYFNDRLQINDVLVIKSSVDTMTGNIRFLGDVIVHGDIKAGFEVYCTGSLEVMGIIEAANVNVGKELVVKGGIQGNARFLVEVGGNLICKFIENASIFAKGDIITDFIVHSKVNCGGTVTIKGKKGLVVGGELHVKTELIADIIGSYMGTRTLIEIGLDPNKRERLESYREEKHTIKNRLGVLRPSIDSGKELLERGLMDQVKKLTFMKVVQEYNHLVQNLKAIDAETKQIEQEIMSNTDGLVVVKNKIYPGTQVRIGRFTRNIRNEVGECRIFISENDILINRT